MARSSLKETGKHLIEANDTTRWITGNEQYATVIIDGTFSSGKIIIEGQVSRDIPVQAAPDNKGGMYGLSYDDLQGIATERVIITQIVDEYTEAGGWVVYISEGIQYRIKASSDFSGTVTAYLSAGDRY